MNDDGRREMLPEEAERLAQFLEGGLEAPERARVLEDLVASPDELNTILVAAEVAAEVDAGEGGSRGEAGVEEIARWRRPSTWAGVGLIAAAAAAITLLPGEIDMLERAVPSGAATALGEGWSAHAWTTLRAASSTLQIDQDQRGFRVGVLLGDLEVATRPGFSAESQAGAPDGARNVQEATLARLRSLLAGGEFIALRALLPAEGAPPSDGLWMEVEAYFGTAALQGRGLEAIRLANLSGNVEFLSGPTVSAFLEAFQAEPTGHPGSEEAARLAALVDGPAPDPEEIRSSLDRLFVLMGG
jgi:hypothetical protein